VGKCPKSKQSQHICNTLDIKTLGKFI